MTAYVFGTFVHETTTTGGTGAKQLSGAGTGFEKFSAPGSPLTRAYVMRGRTGTADEGKYEEGVATITAGSPDTLTPVTVGRSSAGAGTAVTWTAGVTKDVFIAPVALVLNAMLENHASAAGRPGWLPQYGTWLDISATPWSLKLYDGTDDIAIYTVDPATNAVAFAGAGALFGMGIGQGLEDDGGGDLQVKLNATNPGLARDANGLAARLKSAQGLSVDSNGLFVDIDGITAETAPATDDKVAIHDATAGAVRGMTLANLLAVVGSLADLGASVDAANDKLLIIDATDGAAKFTAPQNVGGVDDGEITQAKLSTAQGEVSTTSSTGAHLTLPGGEYGFFCRVRHTPGGGSTVSAQIASSYSGTTYATVIFLSEPAASGTAYANQRYMQSSPPYDFGDGEIHAMVYALVNGLGEVVATSIAPDPVWYNNGPHMRRRRRYRVPPGRLLMNRAPDCTRTFVATRPAFFDTSIEGKSVPVWTDRFGRVHLEDGEGRTLRHLVPQGTQFDAAVTGLPLAERWRAGARTIVRRPVRGAEEVMIEPDVDITREEVLADLARMKAYIEAKNAPDHQQRIRAMTMADKLADMERLPHPFVDVPAGHTVVLVDPLSQLAHDVNMLTQEEEAVSGAELLHSAFVAIGNEDLRATAGRRGPPVMMVTGALK